MAAVPNPMQLIEEWLDFPTRISDKMVATLAHQGVPVSPLAGQVILLAVLGFLIYLAAKFKGGEVEKWMSQVLTGLIWLLGLMAALVVFNWVLFVARPLPSDINGRIQLIGAGDAQSERLSDARVRLLDASGAEIIGEPGRPDTDTGKFFMKVRHELGRAPTTFHVEVPGCATRDIPVTRGQLRHQPLFELSVTCTAPH